MKIEVGNYEKKMVSKLNNELFINAGKILEDSCTSYIGWCGVSKFIDWLEDNYVTTKKKVNK
jgi:hypothetical protein